jgi:hypothetical protein
MIQVRYPSHGVHPALEVPMFCPRTLTPAALIALVAVAVAPLQVESQTLLTRGSYVRVTLESGHTQVGHLESVSEAGIMLRLADQSVATFPSPGVRRVDVRTGFARGSSGAAMGTLLVTAGLGGVIGGATYKPSNNSGGWNIGPYSRADHIALGIALGAVVGVPFAILAGAQEREVWEIARVPRATRPSTELRVGPSAGRGVTSWVSIPVGGRRPHQGR